MVHPFLPPATVVISSPTDTASAHPMPHLATISDHGHNGFREDQSSNGVSSDSLENTIVTSLDPDHIATGGVFDPNEVHIATGVSFDQNHVATGGSSLHHREEIPQVQYDMFT